MWPETCSRPVTVGSLFYFDSESRLAFWVSTGCSSIILLSMMFLELNISFCADLGWFRGSVCLTGLYCHVFACGVCGPGLQLGHVQHHMFHLWAKEPKLSVPHYPAANIVLFPVAVWLTWAPMWQQSKHRTGELVHLCGWQLLNSLKLNIVAKTLQTFAKEKLITNHLNL